MKHTLYKTQGTCSQFIDVTIDENEVVQQVFFMAVAMVTCKESVVW